VVFGEQFLKSDPVSAQAVALGGDPLKRKTGIALIEGVCSGPGDLSES
jgi:hypothetical protein